MWVNSTEALAKTINMLFHLTANDKQFLSTLSGVEVLPSTSVCTVFMWLSGRGLHGLKTEARTRPVPEIV